MKYVAAILVGCCVIAAAIYFGLTYEYRKYMEGCAKRYNEEVCAMTYKSG